MQRYLRRAAIGLLLVIIVSINITPIISYADENKINLSVVTDKSEYTSGDVVNVDIRITNYNETFSGTVTTMIIELSYDNDVLDIDMSSIKKIADDNGGMGFDHVSVNDGKVVYQYINVSDPLKKGSEDIFSLGFKVKNSIDNSEQLRSALNVSNAVLQNGQKAISERYKVDISYSVNDTVKNIVNDDSIGEKVYNESGDLLTEDVENQTKQNVNDNNVTSDNKSVDNVSVNKDNAQDAATYSQQSSDTNESNNEAKQGNVLLIAIIGITVIVVCIAYGADYFVSDGGVIKVKLAQLQAGAVAKLKEMTGKSSYSKVSYYAEDFGLVFSFTMADDSSVHSVVVTKSSDYKEYEYLENGIIRRIIWHWGQVSNSYGILYAGENIDKTITLKDGSTVTCDTRITKMYKRFENNIKEVDSTQVLYASTKDIYLYSESGQRYKMTSEGLTEYESTSFTSPYLKEIGDTGSYIYAPYEDGIRRYRLYDVNDKEINIGLDDLYNNDNYNSIRVSSDDNGYVTVRYYDTNKGAYLNKMYTYFGEHVMNYTGIISYYSGLAGDIYFVNNRAVRFKNILSNGQLTDSALREDSTIKIETIEGTEEKTFSGLKENSSVEDIKNELPGLEIAVIDSEGNTLNVSDKVGTGCTIQSIQNGKVVDTAKVVVKGDIDGTGTIDVLDMEAIQKSILGIGDKLSGAYKEAASLSGGVDITVLDMEVIQKDILGIEKIN